MCKKKKTKCYIYRIVSIFFILIFFSITSCNKLSYIKKETNSQPRSSESENDVISTNIKDYKVFDKVKYGKNNDMDLIWTIIDVNENQLTLYSDYSFDARLNEKERFLEYGSYELNNMFSDEEYTNIVEVMKNVRYEILDSEKYFELFKDNESRKCLGAINGPYKGSKCYFVGGEGEYLKSVNACDENGNLYPAYDVLELPNRLVIKVKLPNKKIVKVNEREEIKKIKHSSIIGDESLEYYKFIDTSKTNENIAHFFDDIVYKNGMRIYIDYAGNEVKIKEIEFKNLNNLKVGDIIYFGHLKKENDLCEQDFNEVEGESKDEYYIDDYTNDYINYNTQKRMIYRVIEKKNGTATLQSVFSIFPGEENLLVESYDTSKLRAWLNEDFYNNYFSNEEKELIIESKKDIQTLYWGIISVSDKINLFDSKDIIPHFKNINLFDVPTINNRVAYNTKPYEEEYAYIKEGFKSENKRFYWDDERDGTAKGFIWNYPNPRTVIGSDNRYYRNKSFIGGGKKEKNTCVVPIIKIKLQEKSDYVNNYDIDKTLLNEISHPDVTLYEELDRAFYIDNDLYYVDDNRNLVVIENYDINKILYKDDIKIIANNIDRIYKIGDIIYYISMPETTKHNPNGYLYVKYKNEESKFIASEVVPLLKSILKDEISFYVDGEMDLFYRKDIRGKVYKYKNGVLYKEYNIKKATLSNLKKELEKAIREKDIEKIKYKAERYGAYGYYDKKSTFLYNFDDIRKCLTKEDYNEEEVIVDENIDNVFYYDNAILYTKIGIEGKGTWVYNLNTNEILKVANLNDAKGNNGDSLRFIELRKYIYDKAINLCNLDINEFAEEDKKYYEQLEKILSSDNTKVAERELYFFDGEKVIFVDNNIIGFPQYNIEDDSVTYKKYNPSFNFKIDIYKMFCDYKKEFNLGYGEINAAYFKDYFFIRYENYIDTNTYNSKWK